jgi:hypothetical protein
VETVLVREQSLFAVYGERLTLEHLNLTTHWAGIAALACFVVAYGIAMAEERLQVRKSLRQS